MMHHGYSTDRDYQKASKEVREAKGQAFIICTVGYLVLILLLAWILCYEPCGKRITGVEVVGYSRYETLLDYDRGFGKSGIYYKLHAEDGTFTLSDSPPVFTAAQWHKIEPDRAPRDGDSIDNERPVGTN